MAEAHVVFLKDRRSISSDEWLDQVDRGVFRAAFSPLNGRYRVAFGTYSSLTSPDVEGAGEAAVGTPPDTGEGVYALVCQDDSTPPCEMLGSLPIRGVPSYIPPDKQIAFALLTLVRGRVGEWSRHVAELEESGDSRSAGALTFGAAGVDAIVEVVAPDTESLHAQLLAMTDVPSVASVEVLYVAPRRTRGFGAGAGSGSV